MSSGRESRTIRVETPSGPRVRARVWDGDGDADAPGLFLVHGFMGSSDSWVPLVPLLPPTRRIVAVDLPGHRAGARSRQRRPPDPDPDVRGAGSYAIPAVARLLGEAQESLFDRPPWWLGYSMGGRIALSAAVQGVARAGLLLESASAGIEAEEDRAARRAQDEARARRLDDVARIDGGGSRSGMEAFVREWLDLPLFAGLAELAPEARLRAFRVRAGQDPREMARWLREGGAGSQPWYGGRMAGLAGPLRVLVGREDRKYAALWKELAVRSPGVRLTLVPGSGHVPHLESPEAWAAWVTAALD